MVIGHGYDMNLGDNNYIQMVMMDINTYNQLLSDEYISYVENSVN